MVDFAHTPEAVTAALDALPPGRRIAVLGCGGDRDQAKRGPMGAAAANGASVVVVTDDNPRSEAPEAIRAAVLAGARQAAATSGAESWTAARVPMPSGWRCGCPNRATGSLCWARGTKAGQELADRRVPFDDVVVVSRTWVDLNGGGDARA